jgi:predicted O-methyltransferase YrrM
VRRRLQRLLVRAARTWLGVRAIGAVLLADPELGFEILGGKTGRERSFEDVERWPEALRDFADCAFVFSSNRANYGIAQLEIDEGAHLFRLIRENGGPCVEIGRYRGGGTLLMAAALPEGHELYSYDTHDKLGGVDPDGPLRRVLARYGLTQRVHLIVADSQTAEPPSRDLTLVFLDGDPTYEGARRDFERWSAALRSGGHLLLHDATPGAPRYAQIGRLIEEINRMQGFERQPDVGTIVHFRRR